MFSIITEIMMTYTHFDGDFSPVHINPVKNVLLQICIFGDIQYSWDWIDLALLEARQTQQTGL